MNDLQFFDVPLRDDPWVSPLQFALHLQLVQSLLVRAFRLLYLTFCLEHIRLRGDQLRIDFGDLSPRGLQGCLLL